MSSLIIAHDVGTSSLKTAVVNQYGEVVAHHTTSYPCHYPKPGWVEQDPADYWNAAVTNTKYILGGVDKNAVVGMVFSTQAMGVIPVDKAGQVLHPNITWVDGRAENEARWLMRLLGGRRVFRSMIGIEITGKDVIPKLRWLKLNRPEVWEHTQRILDVNGYLKFRATGRMVFEWSGACSYGFNLKKKDWERMVFRAAGIDLDKLPPLVRSTDLVGNLTEEAADLMGLPTTVPVYGGCDDTQSAAMGSGAGSEGEAHIYLGTSAWAGLTTARNLKHRNGAVCLQSADPDLNLLVGITESAGSNLEWMIEHFYNQELDDPQITDIYDYINQETEGIPHGSDHLIFTPWLLGERCPVSSTTTRGTIMNLSLEHSRAHMMNALLEGIGFNLKWIFENYKKDFGFNPPSIRAIGGGSVNGKWMQGIANITGRAVETITEPTMAGALGAASCAYVGAGIYKNFSEFRNLVKTDRTFEPQAETTQVLDDLFTSYKETYKMLKGVYDKLNRKRFNE